MKRNGIMRALLIALLSCGIVCALASCGVSYTVSYSLGEHAAENATVPESTSYAEGEKITLPAAPEAEEKEPESIEEVVAAADEPAAPAAEENA